MKPLLYGALIAVLATTVAIGCQSSGGFSEAIARSQKGTDSTKVTLRVENHGFWDVTIYAVPESGVRTRIGTATGNLTTVLTIPDNLLIGGGALQFVGEPIGGGHRSRSDRVYLQPGDELTLTLPPS